MPGIPMLMAITDRRLAGGRQAVLHRCAELLEAGIPAIMLREKGAPARELYEMARALREAATRHGAMLFVNDRVDVAVAAGADGVQLGQASLPAEAVRPLLPDSMWLGVSCHGETEIRAAVAGRADYILLAPVFDPASKARERPALGLHGLRGACATAKEVPVIALGGIGLQNVREVFEAGAAGVAGIGCFFSPDATMDDVRKMLEAPRKRPQQ